MATAVSSTRIFSGFGVLAALLLAGCGGSDPPDPAPSTYTIGGTITGLAGTVVLTNNGGNNLSRSANGSFTFTTALNGGANYDVRVATQPAGQSCSVANGTGTVATANVTNVQVVCVSSFTIGGTVSGLDGTVVLAQSGSEEDSVAVSESGSYQFPARVAAGDGYTVSVYRQPVGQTCAVTAGATGVANANVTNVAVTCVDNLITVSGTVSGLTSGSIGVQLNLADNLTVGNGPFEFPGALPQGSPYVASILLGSVTDHTCNIANPAGTANANVSNIAITCAPLAATGIIGGGIQGLTGTVVLRNSANNETVTRSANGGFGFPTPVAMGAPFQVSVEMQPTGQTCSVANGAGSVSPLAATVVAVICAAGTETHTVGGTVVGLKAPMKLAINLNNDFLDVVPAGTAPVPFTFPVPLQFDTEFRVFFNAQPAGQTCVIPHSGSHVPHANVTDIVVTCVDNVTDVLTGTFTTFGAPFAITFYRDGVYVFGSAEDDPACGTNDGIGVEMGAYRYNAAAGTLAIISNALDTNGTHCGVWQNGASVINGTVVKTGVGQGAVLKLTPRPGEPVVPLVPVASVANQPIGSFFDPNGYSFIVFGDDNRYLAVHANDDPASDAPAGVEYGCYTRTGVNTGTITPTLNTGTCPGAVDTDRTAGLSGLAGVAVGYNVGPGFLVFSQVLGLRIQAN